MAYDSFWHNPQYRITLTEIDEGDEEGNCTLIVGLMQKNRRQIRSTGADLLTVGFAIYHLPYPDRVPKPLDLQFFKYNASVARSPSFINLREVSCRFKLPPGTYCIVPSTFDPNEEGEFLLRVFSENQNNMEYASGSSSTNYRQAREVDDEDDVPSYRPPPTPQEDNAYGYPSYPQPSYPQPSYPPQPSGYPGGYQQPGYPSYPQPGGYSNPQYPGYPPPQPPRNKGDPIMNFFNKENDHQIGYGQLDDKIAQKELSREEILETDEVYKIFLKLAGEDREVDWQELKDILDYSMKDGKLLWDINVCFKLIDVLLIRSKDSSFIDG
ncbi:unnamed protein product [Ceutorhynchus assimilis]|uniref:Peptidase C2 calpain domain-containing protein n=1 Tax=Ceutorhynchus assimilis TaxID=467358 RepID=A0A9N9MHS1_9CUCU|nr:unnamed protein product [Ceutorhynchus assimilis]